MIIAHLSRTYGVERRFGRLFVFRIETPENGPESE